MSKHFRFEIIPAGRWSRLKGTTPRGAGEDRPHIIPKTAAGRRLVEVDASGFIGSTGLCPGKVIMEDGSETLGYRFISISDEALDDFLEQLDKSVENLLDSFADRKENPLGYKIAITSFPPAEDLVPIGTRVPGMGGARKSGEVIGYNGNRVSAFYGADRYPDVIKWSDGYFDVYGKESVQAS